jgi:transposase InsO family protein
MSEQIAFIQACLDRTERIIDICARFGISEKTGHTLLARFRGEGLAAFAARSHAPHRQPLRMSADVEARILALRRRHPDYGPEKLRDRLRHLEPNTRWPATSSIGALLLRAGLVHHRRRSRRATSRALTGERTAATAPNVVWTADFKGEFRLGDGVYCYPLTVLDLHSHYLLGCTALASTAVVPTRAAFTQLFRTYGLPEVIRTDNGIPFAQPNAMGRLGSLAYWWVRLGIRPEHIRPARPAENGAHERFHKTLKAVTTRPRAASLAAQHRRFLHFQREYNTERPHASLAQHVPPAQYYTPSLRAMPHHLPPVWYPETAVVRRVSDGGFIKWHQYRIFLSNNLTGETVALVEQADDLITISYSHLALGDFDPLLHRFTPRVRWLE